MPVKSIVVATDGSPSHDLRVRDAARSARERSVPLHVVCSVPAQTRIARRELAACLPRDLVHAACDAGQREAAMNDIRSQLGQAVPGVELHVSATGLRPGPAARTLADRVGGEVYGAAPAGIKWRRPLPFRALGLSSARGA